MNCFTGHIFDVDELSYPRFIELVQLFVQDPSKLERLLQGFPAPSAIIQEPVPKTPNYRKPGIACKEPNSQALLSSLPHVVLQQVDSQFSQTRRAKPQQMRRWNSLSPARACQGENPGSLPKFE